MPCSGYQVRVPHARGLVERLRWRPSGDQPQRMSRWLAWSSPGKRELHPLMAWWAVLYALSMLSRYRDSFASPPG
ncbi:YaaC family protein [Streptomyces sp. NPDC058441]|uniref:YaaC family protein n=1 Tax=Streptomyces sp. NPDC058441 TaxID=3346502 RepID=UPI0036462257